MIQVPILYRNKHPANGGKIMGKFTITDKEMCKKIHEKLKISHKAKAVDIYCVSIDKDLNMSFSFKSYCEG